MGTRVRLSLARCSSNRGDSAKPFFVDVSGGLEVLRPSDAAETLVTVHGPGQFTGEVSTLSGRRALFLLRAAKTGMGGTRRRAKGDQACNPPSSSAAGPWESRHRSAWDVLECEPQPVVGVFHIGISCLLFLFARSSNLDQARPRAL